MKYIFVFTLSLSLWACSRYNRINGSAASSKIAQIKKGSQIIVKDWDRMLLGVSEEEWKKVESELISQIGKDEFEQVKTKYSYRSMPKAMSGITPENRQNKEQYHQKMDRLKYYYVGNFMTSHTNGEDWGHIFIFKVPYKGNESWDSNVAWDSVYFLVRKVGIEVVER